MGWIAGRVYRQKITIQEGNVFADHTDFPVAIKITGANEVFTKAQSNGYDIVFSNDADETLSYERVRWDPGSQFLFVYVKTDLSSTEGTVLYMYYGNGGHTITVDPEDQTGTWDPNFYAVYHFEEASGQLQDSTSNARHSTTVNTLKYRYTGLLSYSCYFDGSSDYAEVYTTDVNPNRIPGDITHTYKELTVAIYCKPQATGNDRGIFSVSTSALGAGGNDRHIYFDSSGNVRTRVYNRETLDTADTDWADGLWHQIVMAYGQDTGENNKIVVDGQARVTGTASVESDFDWDQRYYFGFAGDAVNDWFYGNMSEVRISRIYRSVEYLRTEYENMINNDTFFVLAAEEDTPYLIEDIPTAITIFDAPNTQDGTRNYLTEFTLSVASTVYYDMPTDVSLADIVQTTSGTDDIAVELGLSASGILTDAELNTDVDFYVSTSGIFNTDVKNTVLDFTVGKQPVPITDPYGGVDVRNELGIGYLVTPSGYGEDVDVEFGIGTTYDTETDLDVDFSIATSAMFNYETEVFASTISGTWVTQENWADPAYAYRQEITVDSSILSNDVIDFPLAVKVGAGNTLFNGARADGYDIFFTEDDGVTVLDYERSIYDAGNTDFQAFVKTTLSGTIDTTIYMYYGYVDAADQSTGTAAWDANFKAVLHFEDGTLNNTPGEIQDSTSNSNDARRTVGSWQLVNDTWAKKANIVAQGDQAGFDSTLSVGTSYTISCLFWKPWATHGSYHTLVRGTSYHHIILDPGTHLLGCYQSGFRSCGFDMDTLSDGLHHVAVTRKVADGLGYFYVDGAFVGTTVTQPTDAVADIGGHAGSQSFGPIDEFRISTNIERAASWIKAEYESLVNYATFVSFGDQEVLSGYLVLASRFETDVTVSGGLSYPINVDVFSSVSGTQYNMEADLWISLANTTPSGLPQDPLISGSYYDAEVTVSGGLSYPLETDLYVSLVDVVDGVTIDGPITSGNYLSTDMRLFALQIDNFFLDVDEYVKSTATMYVDIVDKRGIPIDTANSYFIIDGVPVTSGIWFTPVSRPTASGYRMYYDPLGDFVADDSTEVIVHAQNVINDWLEQTYYLLWGYNLTVNATELHSWGWDKEVIVWSTASNLARCPAESADAWHFRTAPKPFKDLSASIVPQVKHKDLSAVIYPISTAIYYDGTYKITVNLKDSAGNEMPPFILEFTVEDKPN